MCVRSWCAGRWACALAALPLMALAAWPLAAEEPGEAPRSEHDRGRTVAGVTLAERIEMERQQLLLNGAALRRIAGFKIYVAGLYLADKETRADAVLDADAPRTLVMHFLRDVEAKRLCEGWDSSLEKNTPHPSPELREQFRTLCGWMEDAADGERLAFQYVPGEGTRVDFMGRVKGPMAGKEFADALFRTWLGPKPIPGEDFKQRLLGAL